MTAVYRLYDSYGQLLYIGRSKHPEDRIAIHRRCTAGWQLLVDHWSIEWFTHHTLAHRAQQKATLAEGPHHADITCDMSGRPFFLYRLFDEDGRLMYVGQSQNPYLRIQDHLARFPLGNWTTERYPDKVAVCAAERHVIATENPVLNKTKGGEPGGLPSAFDAKVALTWRLRAQMEAGEITVRAAIAEQELAGYPVWKAADLLGLKTWPKGVKRRITDLDRILDLNGLA